MEQKQVIARITELGQRILPKGTSLWLYGSRARGDARPDSDYDLLGDGTVMLLPMHGHSAGMTAVKVGKNADYLIIAGDAGYGRPSWEELILPGVEWNKKEALASLKRLQAFGKDPCCQAILMTHDTDMKQRLFQITEG